MAKKDIDWSNKGFGYIKTDKRFVSNFKDGAWDEGVMTGCFSLMECLTSQQYFVT